MPDDVLARHHVRLVSVDRPGYGRSDPLVGTRMERMADVLDVCDHLGIDTFSAIGVSCGGSNVVALAASAPARVKHLVLSSGQMPYDDESALPGMDPEQFAELEGLRLGRTPEFEIQEAAYRTQLLEDGARDLFDRQTMSVAEWSWLSQGWVIDAIDADLREGVTQSAEGLAQDALMSVQPFEFSMDLVRCPVFAVHGERDDWEPLPNLLRFMTQWPKTQLITLHGMSHLGPLLFPDLLMTLAAHPPRL